MLRVEDDALLRGEGRFLDDLAPVARTFHAAVVRSQLAHARIEVDATSALAAPGVVGVLTGADVAELSRPFPAGIETGVPQYAAAIDTVRYVGEPIAVVVASSRAAAEDAAEDIAIDWERLPVVASFAAALKPDAPKLHPAGNVASRWGYDLGNVDQALASAAAIVRETFAIQRHSAMPLETRGLLASYDRARRLLEVHGPTKVPHTNRALLATMLQKPDGEIRFVSLYYLLKYD